MITVHHLSTSRSERIVWLLEELAPASMKEIHPIGKAPIITDGDTALAESGAIVDYIVRRHAAGRLGVDPQSPDYARYTYWMHFAEGSLMSLMLIALVLTRVPEANESPVKARITTRMKQMLAFVDSELAGRSYFVGDAFTAADVMMLFPFTTMRRYLEYDLAPYPNVQAYLTRIEARPAYEKAMALAGPDAKRV